MKEYEKKVDEQIVRMSQKSEKETEEFNNKMK